METAARKGMRFPGENTDEAQPCGSPTLGDQGEGDGPAKEADVAESLWK